MAGYDQKSEIADAAEHLPGWDMYIPPESWNQDNYVSD